MSELAKIALEHSGAAPRWPVSLPDADSDGRHRGDFNFHVFGGVQALCEVGAFDRIHPDRILARAIMPSDFGVGGAAESGIYEGTKNDVRKEALYEAVTVGANVEHVQEGDWFQYLAVAPDVVDPTAKDCPWVWVHKEDAIGAMSPAMRKQLIQR